MIYRIAYFIMIFSLIFIQSDLLSVEGNNTFSSKAIHHELNLVTSPEENSLTVIDSISLPEDYPSEFTFFLHKNMSLRSHTPGVTISPVSGNTDSIIHKSFTVKVPSGINHFTVEYRGKLYHPIRQFGKEHARSIQQTPGIISHEGIFLSGSSFWYPHINDRMLTFNIMLELPGGWDAVSQGDRTFHDKKEEKTLVRWESPEPQDEIYLVAGKFFEYTKKDDNFLAMAFFRKPDHALAEKYLNATLHYISMYSELIGPYPYRKFAVIENFWETGFGMPSFTLLGPKVIRFPFIVNSSYPHEILHNWWGNSVFPDYTNGNWSEGLTAYLADHLLKEQVGKDMEHRITTLQKYADYVREGKDIPISDFRMRHSASSEAIGYGKSLMVFHMLRQELGNKNFTEGIRDFYKRNLYRFASFEDIRKSFEQVSGKDLAHFFDQWVIQSGAPRLGIKDILSIKTDRGYMITGVIEQTQNGTPYSFTVPVAVTLQGCGKAHQENIHVRGRETEFQIAVESTPLRLDLDPEFDVFRRLDPEEVPPALSQLFGARNMIIVLPSSSDIALLEKYMELGEVLRLSGPDNVNIVHDKDIKDFQPDAAVVVLGWENSFKDTVLSAIPDKFMRRENDTVEVMDTEIQKEKHTIVLASRNPRNHTIAYGFIATDNPSAIPGIGRKLPHYHKYSYLVFCGDEPENILKGRWPVISSPMTAYFPDTDGEISVIDAGSLEQRKPLINFPVVSESDSMPEKIKNFPRHLSQY